MLKVQSKISIHTWKAKGNARETYSLIKASQSHAVKKEKKSKREVRLDSIPFDVLVIMHFS